MSTRYDLIIIGGGGFGSSTAYHAAKLGKKVLVLDQHERGHHLGSSHGETRVIRKAYFEHPDYVPLLQSAYKQWQKLEEVTRRELIAMTGLMISGPQSGPAVTGTLASAEEHGLELEVVSEDLEDRFPGFQFPEDFEVLYEVDGGLLHVEECVDTYLALSEKRGVEFLWSTKVTHWESDGTTAKVWTADTTLEAETLVITAGPWSAKLLMSLPEIPTLQVLQKTMYWFPVMSDAYDLAMGSSCFYFEMPYGEFYGFPSLDGQTIKVSQHSGGVRVDEPEQASSNYDENDLQAVTRFLKEVMPSVVGQPETFQNCFYTQSADGHFIVDHHPELPNVVFGAGFSGHGFKFVPVIGQALAELAINQSTDLPVQFLGLERFA